MSGTDEPAGGLFAVSTNGDGSSDDSRVTLGTPGHHHEWDGTDQQELAFDDADPGTEHLRATPTHSIRSSPTVVDGTVYVGTDDGDLVTRDATTGAEQWRFETDGEITMAPHVAEDTVFVGSEYLYVIDATDGTERWRFEDSLPFHGFSSPIASDGRVFVAWDAVVAVDAATGDEEWSFETKAPITGSSPTVVDGTLFIGSLKYADPDPEPDRSQNPNQNPNRSRGLISSRTHNRSQRQSRNHKISPGSGS